ncbi:MAG: VanZ family protein [Clostridia bacterium]|nr:VanZ family protein [Clostridia bacterium]
MKKVILSIVLLAFAILWAMGIYKLSSMNTQNSNGKSTDIIAMFIEDTLDVTNEYGITNSHPTDSKLARVSQLINAPMRKVMHASVYLVLAFLSIVFFNVLMNNKHYWIALSLALIVSVGFAISDEYHQTFVSGRTGQPLDVLIDSAGAMIGILIYTTYYIVYKNGYKKGIEESESQETE